METTHNLVGFRWHRHACGYDWLYVNEAGRTSWKTPNDSYFDSKQIRGEIAKPQLPVGLGPGFYLCTTQDVSKCELVETAPFESKIPLAWEYVKKPLTAQTVRDFANQWGLVSGDYPGTRAIRDPSNQRRKMTVCAEHASIWSMIHWMDEPIVMLWIAIQHFNKRDLETYVGYVLKRAFGNKLQKLISTHKRGTLLPEDEVAKLYMTSIGNRDIHGLARAMLADMLNSNIESNVTSQIVWDSKAERFRLEFAPRNLSGAMGLQLMMAITRSADFKPCVVCGRWMEVAGGGKKEYCSDACRMKAYRQRKPKKDKSA